MVVLAFLTDPRVLGRILAHLGLPTSPPALAPPRNPYDQLDLDPQEFAGEPSEDGTSVHPSDAGSRDPPADR
jgi:hypothetical protein